MLACCSRCTVRYLYILRCLDQPQPSVSITHRVFPRPILPAIIPQPRTRAKRVAIRVKMKGKGMVDNQSIDRLITAGWGFPRRKHAAASVYILSPRHRATLGLVRGSVGRGPSPHTQILYILYTATCVTLLPRWGSRRNAKFEYARPGSTQCLFLLLLRLL